MQQSSKPKGIAKIWREVKRPFRQMRKLANASTNGTQRTVIATNVYVGCGDDYKEGYVGCDIRKTKNVGIVCKAWELSQNAKNLSNIYSRHMIEHLTFAELEMTFNDWYSALDQGGTVHIICPDLDFHIQQFQNAVIDAVIDEENWNFPRFDKSDLKWNLCSIFGWQREDYSNDDPNKYWDVHKSGYNAKILKFFLSKAGFVNIDCHIMDERHLVATANKCNFHHKDTAVSDEPVKQ